jgi:transposase-like protein
MWKALDAETKLVPSWLVRLRDAHYASVFMHDLARRLRIGCSSLQMGITPT